jgi:hypothetical protein
MGLLEWMKFRMAMTCCGTRQVDVGVVMLTLGEVVVHGRTKKSQNHRSDGQCWQELPEPADLNMIF